MSAVIGLIALLAGGAAAQGGARTVVVDIELLQRPDTETTRLIWLGAPPEGVAGGWLRPGTEPAVMEVGEPMAVQDRWTVAVPMRPGLRYFAVLDADGSGAPSPGDPLGGPLEPGSGGRLGLRIDRRMGEAGRRGPAAAPVSVTVTDPRRTSDESLAPPPLGSGREARISLSLGPALATFDLGRVVIVGFPPGTPWEHDLLPDGPTFRWTSPPLPLRWPLTLEAPLSPGLDLVVGLDLTGDGDLGPGDLVAAPIPEWPGGEEASWRLDRTIPRPIAAPPDEDVRRPR